MIEKIKSFLMKHFEECLILFVILTVIAITFYIPHKLAFLNLFYLPIIIAGYSSGKRMAVLTAFFSVLVVLLSALLSISSFSIPGMSRLSSFLSLMAWGSFLILTSAAMGHLYEEKERRIRDLKEAYIGVLEIMSKYLESAGRYTKGHSIRVAHLSEDIANIMGLPGNEIENIKAAALLHDIGKTEVSMTLVNKAATLSTVEKELLSAHTEKGADILSLVGSVLKEAVPIVLSHHQFYFEHEKFSSEIAQQIPLGASIIAVADAYDAIVTDRPYRAGKPPWKAYEEIEKESGRQFHPDVIKAFKQVLHRDESYRLEKTLA